MQKKYHEFIIDLDISEVPFDIDTILERLGSNGCTDATIGIGRRGNLSLVFNREASSEDDAFRSAIEDIERALPECTISQDCQDSVYVLDKESASFKAAKNALDHFERRKLSGMSQDQMMKAIRGIDDSQSK